MNETQLWFWDLCDKTNINENKRKHKNYTSHKHKQKYGTVVKEYEFNNSDIDLVNYLLNDTIKDCRKKYFHSFENKCVFDIKLTKIRNNEEIILSITFEYMKLKSQFSGLFEKN